MGSLAITAGPVSAAPSWACTMFAPTVSTSLERSDAVPGPEKFWAMIDFSKVNVPVDWFSTPAPTPAVSVMAVFPATVTWRSVRFAVPSENHSGGRDRPGRVS